MSAQDVFENREVELVVSLGGRYPKGSPVRATFYKGEGTTGEVLGRAEAPADQSYVTLKWTARGPADHESHCLVTWTVTLPESSRESQKDHGLLRVWMESIRVLATNADDGDAFFAGARFVVAQASTEKTYELAPGDEAGVVVELADFAVPAVAWAAPYELVEWVAQGARRWEARVRRPTFRARFVQPPERDAEPAAGRFTRKQYVNVTPGTPPAPDEGSRVTILVGADVPSRAGWEVWLEAQFGDTAGRFSRRDAPLPALDDADDALGDAVAGEPLDADLPDAPRPSDARRVRFRKKLALERRDGFEPGEHVAAFALELGQAGGDVCTVRVGSTPACRDATLEITNWRRVGYHIRCPGPALSTRGGFEVGNPDLPAAAKTRLADELAKGFVEHVKASAQFYDAGAWPEFVPRGVHDGAVAGKAAGTKVFVVEESPLATLAERLRPRGQKPWEHTIVVADCVTEVVPGAGEGTAVVALTSASRAVTLCTRDWGVYRFERQHRRPSIHYLELKVTRLAGRTLTADRRDELVQTAGPLARWFDPGGVRVWSRATGDADACALRDRYVTHDSAQKITLTLPAAAPDDPGQLFQAFTGVTVVATVFFEKRDPASCLGMAYPRSGGTLALATLAGDADPAKLHTTLLHELSHAFGQAYGSTTDLPVSGRASAEPGLRFRAAVASGGYVYDQHGHRGAHCAFGLSERDRAEPSYEAGFTAQGARMNLAPRCVNWGNEAYVRTRGLALCKGCAAALRGQSLADLRAIE